MLLRRELFSALAGSFVQTAKRPNVILVITDDQGFGDLSLHGNKQLRTPNLDRLAGEGARFERYYSSPVCSPTRACLLTGRYNYRTGVVDTYLGRSMMRPGETTLAEMLRKAGYRTGIFGKWHLGDNYPLRSIDQGFDESLVLNGGGLVQPGDVPEAISGVKPSYFDPVLSRNGRWEQQKGYCTDIFFREAGQFIERNQKRPFFCYLATNAPHTPLEVDEALVKPFREQGLDETTARIYAMVANLDENMGRLNGVLRKTGLERDTILMFMTDNGPQQRRFNDGLRGLKGSPYEGGIRVPLLVRWPARIQPGTVVDRAAAHIDITPTVLECAGAAAPAGLDGRSLAPLLTDPKASASWSDRTLYLQWHRGDAPRAFENSAVVTQRWKLINGKELYDLSEDRAESRDLAASEANVVRQLRMSYEAWFRDVGAGGYEPPRIVIGRKAPVLLTRQDWRGPAASWDSKGLGHWEVQVEARGPYTVTVYFEPPKAETMLEASWVGRHVIAAGQDRLELKGVKVPAGAARFEARVGDRGVHYAWIR
ncbi:MAG: arylsulfatase [Acidobacteriota bacterium]